MKKSLYICLLIATWIALGFIFGLIQIATGLVPTIEGWDYALGVSMAKPPFWLLSIGLVMLFRKFLYKLVFSQAKEFSKQTAIIVLVLGGIWVTSSIATSFFTEYTSKKALATYHEHLKKNGDRLKGVESIPEESIKDFEEQCIKMANELNQQLPIKIDDVTYLKQVVFANMTMTVYYSVEVDVNDYESSDIEDFLATVRSSQIEQIPRMFKTGNYEISQKELYRLYKLTGIKFRFVYKDMYDNYMGANQFDYTDFSLN